MLWDNHMHSNFSGDSDALPEEMIKSAKSKGLRGMTFTDHLDLDYPPEFGFFDLDLKNYYPILHNLALKNNTEDFTILTGIEIGIQPHIADECLEIVNAYDFDFVIGSTHLVDKSDPYFDVFWENCDEDAKLRCYYESILKNIQVFTDFDSVGHLDYIFRYINNPSKKNDTYAPYAEIVDAILSQIIKSDKALEVNTAGLRKGLKYPNPCKDILCRYKELGGKLITIGADAHTPEDVASGFDYLPVFLKDCGFNEFAVYIKRKPNIYPI